MNDILLYLFLKKIRNYEPSLINVINKYVIPTHKFQINDILILNPEVKTDKNDDNNNIRINTYDNKLTHFREKKFDTFEDYFNEKNNLIKQLYFSYYVKIKKIVLVFEKNCNYYKYIYVHYITGYHYSEHFNGEYFLIESCNDSDYTNYCFEEHLDKLNKWEKMEFDMANAKTNNRMKTFYL